jgi:hypothetical protein
VTDVVSIDPRTARIAEVVSSTTTTEDLDALCASAAAAAQSRTHDQGGGFTGSLGGGASMKIVAQRPVGIG